MSVIFTYITRTNTTTTTAARWLLWSFLKKKSWQLLFIYSYDRLLLSNRPVTWTFSFLFSSFLCSFLLSAFTFFSLELFIFELLFSGEICWLQLLIHCVLSYVHLLLCICCERIVFCVWIGVQKTRTDVRVCACMWQFVCIGLNCELICTVQWRTSYNDNEFVLLLSIAILTMAKPKQGNNFASCVCVCISRHQMDIRYFVIPVFDIKSEMWMERNVC